ncbi:MAG TPA: cysteine--tRNA ligase [Candidatus Absconditabacterales bacterium]|nr:cysteine--tRNA ligase [Candidatus Absconditabacterales bacterium]
MKFQIYNTMTHKKEEFIPRIDEGKADFVGIYSCGPTVYRNPHIGNMRAFSFADLLRNTIKNILGYPTKHVMNLTDVGHLTDDGDDGEDKMEKGAKRDNMTVRELADKYITEFYKYLDSLNIEKFDVFCRATDHIQEQINMVKTLEEKGYTYKILSDGIYMDTSKVEDYGKLAGLENQSLRAGARIQNENKKNPTDFSLRKFSKPGEKRQMERDSPRGVGFPGWHLECSAMSSKYLGEQFDIHTGGVDHIGVHHTNEIAQSECTFDKKPRVKYRMHNQFLNLGGKKVAKADGGLVTVSDIEAQGYSALDLKMLYYTAHYRSFLDFNQDVLEQAKKQRQNIIKKIHNFDGEILDYQGSYQDIESQITTDEAKEFFNNSISAILDDLNTPRLLAEINKALHNPNSEIISIIKRLDNSLLRLDLFDFLILSSGAKSKDIEIPQEIQKLGEDRLSAKQNKDRATADKIRDDLKSKGRNILDTKDGFELEKI